MSMVVPDVGEVDNLNKFLNQNLILKLFSNNYTPTEADTAANYTEVAGGGYVAFALSFANWVVTGGAPTTALYNSAISFNFTGPTAAPGTVYGYYVVDNSGNLKWAERFPPAVLPFSPGVNSLIRITPQFQAS